MLKSFTYVNFYDYLAYNEFITFKKQMLDGFKRLRYINFGANSNFFNQSIGRKCKLTE